MKRQSVSDDSAIEKAEKAKKAQSVDPAETENKDKSATPADPSPDDYVFFFGGNPPYGVFSQWAKVSFTVPKARLAAVVERPVEADDDVITFSCAEQCMMYCKAARFGDTAAQRAILAASSPREHKQLGRSVRGFTDKGWDPVKRAVVREASVAKFGSTPELRQLLLATGDRIIVEAAPRDRIWGIGFGAASALANRSRWGKNLLGQALMEARAELREEETRV